MIGREQIEAYRRMTPAQKIREMLELLGVAERALRVHKVEEVRRRLHALDMIKARSTEAMLSKLSEIHDESPGAAAVGADEESP